MARKPVAKLSAPEKAATPAPKKKTGFKPGNTAGKNTQFKKGHKIGHRFEPKYIIDDDFLQKVRLLGGLNATYEDAAIFLGMSHQNFGRLVRENEKVTKAFESGKTNNRLSLRRKLTSLAIDKDNVAAAIFLAKQAESNGGLGMSDRAEISGKDGGPVQIQFIEGDDKL